MADFQKSEVRDGMRIDWDVPIQMEDGVVLRADVFRPLDEGKKYPVIMTYGPYAKGLAYQEGYKTVWEIFSRDHPEAIAGSSNKYQNWEVVDPEKWVPDGYVCVRVDSRGAGRSPGYLEIWSPRETKDYAICIDWAGTQPWSNGKVGLNGISYYAMNQWMVATLQPKHLAAMCPWEGAADFYRDVSHHGGIFSTFCADWYDTQVRTVQHGLGERGRRSRVTGEPICGPETLSPEELKKNIDDYGESCRAHPLDDAHWKARTPDWSKVKTPFLSAASWGGQGLHPRGNFEAFYRAASKDKWLDGHGLEHWTHFYTPYGEGMQKRFFGHFLKGEDTGWKKQPRVLLQIRHVGEKFVERHEKEWPLKRTKWTKFYLNPSDLTLGARKSPAGKLTYEGLGEGATFLMPPFKADTEITGPVAAKLFVSSETADADIFLVLRLFTPDMREVTFSGTVDPHTPIGQGWLRASHRKLDKKLTKPWRPYHSHDEKQPLKPGQVFELNVEIWPTCIVVPAGYRLGLTVRGKDYVYPGEGLKLSNMKVAFTGCGPFLHDSPMDRPPKIFGKKVTLHAGGSRQPYLLLPIILGRKK